MICVNERRALSVVASCLMLEIAGAPDLVEERARGQRQRGVVVCEIIRGAQRSAVRFVVVFDRVAVAAAERDVGEGVLEADVDLVALFGHRLLRFVFVVVEPLRGRRADVDRCAAPHVGRVHRVEPRGAADRRADVDARRDHRGLVGVGVDVDRGRGRRYACLLRGRPQRRHEQAEHDCGARAAARQHARAPAAVSSRPLRHSRSLPATTSASRTRAARRRRPAHPCRTAPRSS